MKQTDRISTTTYEHGEFLVDIVTTEDSYEAWICRKNYGMKALFFGVFKKQNTLDKFLELVKANLDVAEAGYDEEYPE